MSFLLRTHRLPGQSLSLSAIASRRAPLCTSTPLAQRSAVDSAKDALKSADRTVSQAAVKGIDKAEEAAQAMKSSASATSSEVKGKASEVTGEVKGKASELKGEAKGKAAEIKGKM